MKSFEIAVYDYKFSPVAMPEIALPGLEGALEGLCAFRRESIALTLSVEYPNFMCRTRAELLESEFREIGYTLGADAIVRALVVGREIGGHFIVLRPSR